MRLLARFITILVRISGQIAGLVFRVQQLLTGILPVLLPPEELTRLIRTHYDRSYQNVAARLPEACYKWTLESWEEDVLACHKMTSGTILVLGAGVGRESIALAERGFVVVGLDINRKACASLLSKPWPKACGSSSHKRTSWLSQSAQLELTMSSCPASCTVPSPVGNNGRLG